MVVMLQSARPLLLKGTRSHVVPAGFQHSPARRRAACASRGRNRGEKVTSGARAGSLPGVAEDAYGCVLIAKGDVCCVDPLCRALLNTTALVGAWLGQRTAPVPQLLSYKCGRHPYSSWASKEKSNFLNAFC